MKANDVQNYRDYLNRYAEITKQRRPSFSLGSWARALGLKSTSSLTKVLNGEREAGPDLVQRFVKYFKFNDIEEAQFRNLVALSKMKESTKLKQSLAEELLRAQKSKDLKVRLLEMDQFELLRTYLPLAVRELVRLPNMKIAKLKKIIPDVEEGEIQNALHLLGKMGFVSRDNQGHFVSNDPNLWTEHETSNESIQSYHGSTLDLAKEKLESVNVLDREFQSLVFLMNSSRLPEVKDKVRKFLDSLESEIADETVDQLYQVQVQCYPISKRFDPMEKKI